MESVKIDIPEIKPFTLEVSYNTYDKPNLGCHVRGLSDLSLTYENTPNVGQWIDPSKHTKGDTAYTYISKWLKNNGLPAEQIENIFSDIVKDWDLKFGEANIPPGGCFVLMSDAVNSGSSLRNSGSIYRPKGLTIANFVQYIIERKIGIVIGTPIGRNSLHNTSLDTSLVQLWIWIPPGHVPFMMPGSAFMYGAESLPDWSEWWDITSKSTGIKSKEDIQKKLFNDSLFTRAAVEA